MDGAIAQQQKLSVFHELASGARQVYVRTLSAQSSSMRLTHDWWSSPSRNSSSFSTVGLAGDTCVSTCESGWRERHLLLDLCSAQIYCVRNAFDFFQLRFMGYAVCILNSYCWAGKTRLLEPGVDEVPLSTKSFNIL